LFTRREAYRPMEIVRAKYSATSTISIRCYSCEKRWGGGRPVVSWIGRRAARAWIRDRSEQAGQPRPRLYQQNRQQQQGEDADPTLRAALLADEAGEQRLLGRVAGRTGLLLQRGMDEPGQLRQQLRPALRLLLEPVEHAAHAQLLAHE